MGRGPGPEQLRATLSARSPGQDHMGKQLHATPFLNTCKWDSSKCADDGQHAEYLAGRQALEKLRGTL